MPPGSSTDRDLARRIASDCLAVRVRALHRRLSRLYEDALRPHGLTVAQLNLLVAVTALGGAAPGTLCQALELEKSTLSRNVERMVREGWLENRPEPAGRGRRLLVTRRGRGLLRRVEPAWREAQRRARALLGPRGTEGLLAAAATLGA